MQIGLQGVKQSCSDNSQQFFPSNGFLKKGAAISKGSGAFVSYSRSVIRMPLTTQPSSRFSTKDVMPVRRRKSAKPSATARAYSTSVPSYISISLQWCQARIHIALQRTVRISEDSPLSCPIALSNVHDGKDRLATAI
jgi:hypothetical protein